MWICKGCGIRNEDTLAYCSNCLKKKEKAIKTSKEEETPHFDYEKLSNFSNNDETGTSLPHYRYYDSKVPIWILVYCTLIPILGWLFEAAYIANDKEDKAKKILIVQAITYIIIGLIVFLFVCNA